MARKKTAVYAKQIFFALLGIALVAAFIHRFGCPILYLFGVSCPGCGMSRAVRCCLRLDFAGAWHCHPLVFILPVLLALLIVFRKNNRALWIVLGVFFTLLCGVYVYRAITDIAPDVIRFQPETGLLWRMVSAAGKALGGG